MDIQIIASLLSLAAASGMASKNYEALRDRLIDKVETPLPTSIESDADVATVTAAITDSTSNLSDADTYSVTVTCTKMAVGGSYG